MRAMMLAMTVMVVTLVQTQSEPPKSAKPDVGPRARCVVRHHDDRYVEGEGVLREALPVGSSTPFKEWIWRAQIAVGGTEIGTLRVAEGPISGFNGVVYVQVPSMPESCAKVKELGGRSSPDFHSTSITAAAAVGLATDPLGHPFGMYCRTPLAPQKPAAPEKARGQVIHNA